MGRGETETHLPKTFEMLCTCQNAQINNARQLRLHYPRRRSRRGRVCGGGNKNMKCKQKFQIKRQPSRGSSNKRTRVEFSQRSSGTKDDKNDGGMPPKSEARQAQALPSFGALLSSALYVSSLSRSACCCCSDCDYFDDDGDRFVP